jgi:hypothetical protein
MRSMSGAEGLSLVQLLVLFPLVLSGQVVLNQRMPDWVLLGVVATTIITLYFLNLRATKTRQFAIEEERYNRLPEWQRWSLLALFVCAMVLILLTSVRLIDVFRVQRLQSG